MLTSVALGPHFEAFIREQVAKGRYNNASEVVRDGLRMLEDRQLARQAKLGALRTDLEEGMNGPFIPAEEAFAEVRRRIQQASKAKAG